MTYLILYCIAWAVGITVIYEGVCFLLDYKKPDHPDNVKISPKNKALRDEQLN